MGFICLEEAFSVGVLDIIADYAFLSTFKLLWGAHTVRVRPILVKEVIDRFWKASVHKLKGNAKAVPKNSKETSGNNTDVEMDLDIFFECVRMLLKRAKVFAHL